MSVTKLSVDDLNVLLNPWPVGTPGWQDVSGALALLDRLAGGQGRDHDQEGLGYGFLQQLATQLNQIQFDGQPAQAIALKRSRFRLLNYPLPRDFEALAAKLLAIQGG